MQTLKFEDGSIKMKGAGTQKEERGEAKQHKARRLSFDEIIFDPNNPRVDFEGLEELAATFAYTHDRPGEPFIPPIVVPDGNKYRCIDGERRLRAMMGAEVVESCLCYVADSLDEANAVAMMMATDEKKPLTDQERSQGVQQMLILGVDFEEVEHLGKLKKGYGKKIKRALDTRKDVGKKPIQTSMKTLMEIAEIDNPHRMGELVKMIDEDPDLDTSFTSEFKRKLNSYASEKRGIERKRELEQALAKLKVPMQSSPEEPDGYMYIEEIVSWEDPEDVIEQLLEDGFSLDEIVVYIELGGCVETYGQVGHKDSTTALIYAKKDAVKRVQPDAFDDDEAEPSEKVKARNEFKKQKEHHSELQRDWLVANAESLDGKPLGNRVLKLVKKKLKLDKDIEKQLADSGTKSIAYSPWMIAAVIDDLASPRGFFMDRAITDPDVYKNDGCWEAGQIKSEGKAFIDRLELLSQAGYELSDWEMEVSDKLTAWIEGTKEDETSEEEEVESEAA